MLPPPHSARVRSSQVHFDLFFVMLIFLVQTAILIRALKVANDRNHRYAAELRNGSWPRLCDELRRAYALARMRPHRASQAHSLLRRVLQRPYYALRADALRAELRFILLRARFVKGPSLQARDLL